MPTLISAKNTTDVPNIKEFPELQYIKEEFYELPNIKEEFSELQYNFQVDRNKICKHLLLSQLLEDAWFRILADLTPVN
jgi:hypothetical protein